MTLLKNTAVTRTSSSTMKTTSITVVGKKLLSTNKPNTTPSPLKGKVILSTSMSPRKVDKSPLKVSATKVTSPVSTIRTSSPVINKVTGPTKPCSGSTVKTIVGDKPAVKSAISKTPERKPSPELKKEPARGVVASSPKSKPTSPKSNSVLSARSASSPIKSVSPSLKPSITRSTTSEKVKQVKAGVMANMRTPTSPAKSSTLVRITKPSTPVKTDAKLKTIIKKPVSPSPKVPKSKLTLKIIPLKIDAASSVIVDELVTPDAAKKLDLCHCSDVMVDRHQFNHELPSITECAIDGDFDIAQAFKVAEQLIRIQGEETTKEKCDTSKVNWEDIITPYVDINSSDAVKPDIRISELEKARHIGENENLAIVSNVDLSLVSNGNHAIATSNGNCIDVNLNDSLQCNGSTDFSNIATQDGQLLNFENKCLLSHGLISDFNAGNGTAESIDRSESISRVHQNGLVSSDVDFSTTANYSTLDSRHDVVVNLNNSVRYHSFDAQTETIENRLASDSSNDSIAVTPSDLLDEENSSNVDEKPAEWTIIIDEFSLDMEKKENLPTQTGEGTCEMMAALSYADVLKKTPKVFANSTNLQNRKLSAKPKLNLTMQIKEYHMLKKVEALYSTNIFFNADPAADAENNYDNFEFDQPEFPVLRKKSNAKKVKYFSKRHFKNACRDYEYAEGQTDVFITPVWKNIY